jgi:hypothetical protein
MARLTPPKLPEMTFDLSLDLDSVLIERVKVEKEKNPDIELMDKVILKDGPRAYKVAQHWIFVNRNTGEIHHHALIIETYQKL